MGWLFMSVAGMGGFRTPKTYLDNQLTYPPDPQKDRATGLRVLKSVWQGSVYYAAAEPYGPDGKATEPVFAVICLVRWNPKARSGEHFGYKDMEENMGPCETGCPASVLELLGTPSNDYAKQWRQACRARLALTSRSRPKAGDRLILPEPMSFVDGYEARAFTVVDYRKRIVLRGDNGGYYRVPKLMERAWTLVPKAQPAFRSSDV